jgi:hypothetical protein
MESTAEVNGAAHAEVVCISQFLAHFQLPKGVEVKILHTFTLFMIMAPYQ